VGGVGLSLALLLNSVGCGGGSHRGGGSPSTGGAFKIASVSGRVAMPGGVPVPAGATVSTALGAFPVKGDGSFIARVVDALPSLVTVSAGGTPLMMGMFGKDRTTIDATSEALALCLLRTGAGVLPYDTLRVIVLKGGDTDAVKGLAQAFESRGAANPTFSGLAQVTKAEIAAASTAFLSGGSRGIQVVDADPKSGVTVIQESLQRIVLQNAYRRRAYAYVDRVGYVPHDSPAGTPETASPKDLGKLSLEPTIGVSSLTGAFLDAVAGRAAYAPTTSEPMSLPNEPSDADTTRYKVTVVGLGASAGGYDALSGDRRQEADGFLVDSLFADLVIPTFYNLVLGGYGLNKAGAGGFYADDSYLTLVNYARSLIDLARSGIPTLTEDVYAGRIGKAVSDTIDFVVNDPTAQGKFAEALTALGAKAAAKAGSDPAVFTQNVKNVFVMMAAGDLLLSAVDFAAVLHDIAASDRASEFTVRTTASRVKLTPPFAETNAVTDVPLEAHVLDVASDEQGIAYDWSVSGVGALKDGTQTATAIHERDGKLAFSPNAGQFGDATVTVRATKTNADGSVEDLGKAMAKVSVKDVSVTLLPRRQSVKPGGTITFSAKVLNDYAPNHDYLYRFSVTGGLGTIAEKDLLGTPIATYRAGSARGKDTVRVEVFRLVQGSPLKIAETTGEARIEEEPTIIQGTLQFFRESYADGTTPYRCISAYVGFSPPPGATRLVLHGYGGNDTAYYGTSIERTLYPPFSAPSFIGTPIPNATGLSGGGGAGTEDPDDSYYRSRFGGFTWEIEVYK